MAEGRSNIAIAARLNVSPKTLEAHIRRILQRLGLEESPMITGAFWLSWNICVHRTDLAAGLAQDPDSKCVAAGSLIRTTVRRSTYVEVFCWTG
jgi:hypothetical protein